MKVTRVDKWVIITTCVVMFGAIPFVFIVAQSVFERPRIAAAEAAVAVAAAALARGELPPNVELNDFADRSALSKAFASGWQISGYDTTGLNFNAYEIRVSVPGDGQYNFNAHRSDGEWHVACCAHSSELDLRNPRGATP